MTLIPIYTSKGDAEAFLDYPYLYNRTGDWIGWVTSKRDVYSVLGALRWVFDKRSTHSEKTRHFHAQTSTSTPSYAQKGLSARDDSACPIDGRISAQCNRHFTRRARTTAPHRRW